jgi:hypothetical protein
VVDEAAERHVLEPVADAAHEVADDHEAEHEPERRGRLAEPLDCGADEGRSRERRQRNTASDDERAEDHPDRPGGVDRAEAQVLHPEHLDDVHDVRGNRRGHEEERDEGDGHRQGKRPVGEEIDDAVARPRSRCVVRL